MVINRYGMAQGSPLTVRLFGTDSRNGGFGKTVAASIGAGLVTLSIFTMMQSLISEDFIPQDRLEIAAFEINPRVVDIDPVIQRLPPDKLKQVEIPPAPPVIETVKTGKPSETSTIVTPEPVAKPIIDLGNFHNLNHIDRELQPIVQIMPTMPRRAERSGHCLIGFDISAEGKPFNVSALSCSQSLFERAAITAVGRWTYRPEIIKGKAIGREGMRTRIVFQVTDEADRIIPE